VVQEHGPVVVKRGEDIDRVDEAEGGVHDELACFDRARVDEERIGRPVVRERVEDRVRVADRRAVATELPAGVTVRRPVLGSVRPFVSGMPTVRFKSVVAASTSKVTTATPPDRRSTT
jgi:hypothetical protein